jgi:hypothetical protein
MSANERNDMTRQGISRFVVACASAAVLLFAAVASAQPAATTPGDPLDPRTTDPAAEVFLSVDATGFQKYACQPNGTWLFTDPVATLFKTNGASQAIGTHFLNFATGRPVWRLNDGSTVEPARTASASGGAGNIAQLLLKTVVASAGDDGDRLAQTTWVQRLDTSGGVAPAGTCTPGDLAAVPYTAEYVFWRTGGDAA